MSTRRTPAHASPPAPAPSTTTTPSAPATPTPIAPADIIHVTTPPVDVHVPPPPAGFVPVSDTLARGVAPRKGELVAAPAAVTELRSFADYAGTFGRTAPSQTQVVQMLDAANQWTTLRNAAAAWDKYCASQETIAWSGVRLLLARLEPSFDLAVQGDPSLSATYPNLTTLLGVRKAIGRKAGATNRANNRARAAGKPATHGAVGKKRQRAADKAAGAAAEKASTTPTPATPVVAPAPVSPASTPAPVTPVVPVTTVTTTSHG